MGTRLARWTLWLVLLAPGCRSVDLSPSTVGRDASVPVLEVSGLPRTDGGVDAARVLPDGGTVTPSVTIASPTEGTVFRQDTLVAGDWAASVDFQVDSVGVARTELVADGTFILGDTDETGLLNYAFTGTGTLPIAAIGYDAAGTERARDEISIRVDPPGDTSCHAMLDALGLDWTTASARPGIADPVLVEPVINSVTFRYSTNAPAAMVMDCELAIRLYRMTEILIPHGIDEVIHLGIYNYRCIGGGDPDSGTCTPSQHAYARGIDLHAFGLAGSATVYSTEDDFVITSRADPCPISSFSEADRVLKEIACTLYADRIFQIVLTPNYNADHRNHYHVDLTAGAMYLGQGVGGVDPPVGEFGH